MESYYTWGNYFRILAAVLMLLVLVPVIYMAISRGWRRLLSFPAILLIAAEAIIPITPFPALRRILENLTPFLVPFALLWLVFFIWKLRRPDMRNYQGWIIDNLRESVLVFDRNLRLQGSSGPVAGLPEESSSALLEELRTMLRSGGSGEGMLRFRGRIYRGRYRPVEGGWLLTLHDLTEEQQLLDELLEKNRLLERQRTLLKTTEGIDLSVRREEYRRDITTRIQDLVREKLETLLELTGGSAETDSVLACAEEAMADIRAAVGQLASKGETT